MNSKIDGGVKSKLVINAISIVSASPSRYINITDITEKSPSHSIDKTPDMTFKAVFAFA